MIIVGETSGCNDLTPLTGTSLCLQTVVAVVHLVLSFAYARAFPEKQYPNMVVVFKAWSAWLNVLMAGVMLLRDHGVEWAVEFYGVKKESRRVGEVRPRTRTAIVDGEVV